MSIVYYVFYFSFLSFCNVFGDIQQDALKAHNKWRSKVKPPAVKPLTPLKWYANLAAAAQEYAKKCYFEHDQPPSIKTLNAPDGQPFADRWVGQNLYTAGGEYFGGIFSVKYLAKVILNGLPL